MSLIIALLAFILIIISYSIISYFNTQRNLKKYYNEIKIGDIYVIETDSEFPQKYSPFNNSSNDNRYEIIDKKNGWLQIKQLSSLSIFECSVKEMYEKNYILEKNFMNYEQ